MNILKRIGGAITGDRKYTANDMRRLAEFVRSREGRRLTAELIRQTDSLTKRM